MEPTNEKTTRTDLNVDEMEHNADNEMEMISNKREASGRRENDTGNTQGDTISAGTERENPFKPRASLSRSPTRLPRTQQSNPPMGADEDVLEVMVIQQPTGIEKSKENAPSAIAKQGDSVVIPRELLKKLSNRAGGATTAISAIYEYAKSTKNVSRILREKSGLALNYLESLAKELEGIQRAGLNITGMEGMGAPGKIATVNCATQTECHRGKEDRAPTMAVDSQDGYQRKGRTATSEEIKASYHVAGDPLSIVSGGDKRKERTPPELNKAKRSRVNGNQMGIGIQPGRRANEPLRGKTQEVEELLQPDQGSPSTRLPPDCTETKEQDMGISRSSPRRRNRRPPPPEERWDYGNNIYQRERMPFPLYSDVASGARDRPYCKAYRKSVELEYLRKARIPHWEWRRYSSRESSDDDGNEETYSREILESGDYPRPDLRGSNKRNYASDKRQEALKGDIPKRPRRPRRRIKPEAVLVRIEQGGTYLDTYKTIASELKSLKNGVKGVRKTRTGHLLIEIGQDSKVEEVGEKVRSKLGEGAQVRLLQETTTFQLRGLDPIISKDEVAADMAEAGKIDPVEVSVQTLRPLRDGTQVAIVRVPTRKVNGELRSGRIRIGLVVCRAKILPDITRCFRCHQIGHVGTECRNLEKGKYLCRKCGSEGHNMETCNSSPRCVLCSKSGMEGIGTRHVAGALNCPTFRGKMASGING